MTTVEQKLEILIGKLQIQLVTVIHNNEELQVKVHELQAELDVLKSTPED